MNEFIFVISFTVIGGVCWYFIGRMIQGNKERHTSEYLCGIRSQLLRSCIPDCLYASEGSVNGKCKMMQYSSGNEYFRSLGYMTFVGKYEGIQIDDAITEYNTKDSDLPNEYYESLLFACHIPEDSPVYDLGYMNVRRVSKTRTLFSKAVTSVKNGVFNMLGGSDSGETKRFTIGHTGIEAVIPAGSAQDRWIMLLQQGLSERIEKIFRMYGNVSHVEIGYNKEMLFICVCNSLGYDQKFDEKNDFVIGNAELLCRTLAEMKGLCYDYI